MEYEIQPHLNSIAPIISVTSRSEDWARTSGTRKECSTFPVHFYLVQSPTKKVPEIRVFFRNSREGEKRRKREKRGRKEGEKGEKEGKGKRKEREREKKRKGEKRKERKKEEKENKEE